MDLADYSQAVFDKIRSEFGAFAGKLNLRNITYIPMSALNGDMVVGRGGHLNWYQGSTLMDLLETVSIEDDINREDFRFPVNGCAARKRRNCTTFAVTWGVSNRVRCGRAMP